MLKPTQKLILIIDDHTHAADSLSMVFEMFGHSVQVAYNGFDGILKAKTIKPDFILCDIGLPDINGYDVAEILKMDEDLKLTYLIAISGYVQPADIEKTRKAGFDLYMPKPPDLARLEQVLQNQGLEG